MSKVNAVAASAVARRGRPAGSVNKGVSVSVFIPRDRGNPAREAEKAALVGESIVEYARLCRGTVSVSDVAARQYIVTFKTARSRDNFVATVEANYERAKVADLPVE
jgi:hypothetical protein